MEDGLMAWQISRGESRRGIARNLSAPQSSRLFAKEQSAVNLSNAARAVKILNRENFDRRRAKGQKFGLQKFHIVLRQPLLHFAARKL